MRDLESKSRSLICKIPIIIPLTFIAAVKGAWMKKPSISSLTLLTLLSQWFSKQDYCHSYNIHRITKVVRTMKHWFSKLLR